MLQQSADAEHVVGVADGNAVLHAIGPHDHGYTRGRLGCIRRLGFGDQRGFRYSLAHQVVVPNAAFAVLGIGGCASSRDHNWGQAFAE